jgi:hypothetical protein
MAASAGALHPSNCFDRRVAGSRPVPSTTAGLTTASRIREVLHSAQWLATGREQSAGASHHPGAPSRSRCLASCSAGAPLRWRPLMTGSRPAGWVCNRARRRSCRFSVSPAWSIGTVGRVSCAHHAMQQSHLRPGRGAQGGAHCGISELCMLITSIPLLNDWKLAPAPGSADPACATLSTPLSISWF